MLLFNLLLAGSYTYTVNFPTTASDGTPFNWSIVGGQPGEGFWATTTAPGYPTYGSSSSYYGTLDSNGNATITGWDFSPNNGTYTVTIHFQYGTVVNKSITVAQVPITYTTNLNSVTYGAGAFVAVGASGSILRSTDGTKWHVVSSGVTTFLRKVAYLNSYFIAVGDSGTFLYSTDGITWTANTNVSSSFNLYSLSWNGTYYLIAGNNGTAPIVYATTSTSISSTFSNMGGTTLGALSSGTVTAVYYAYFRHYAVLSTGVIYGTTAPNYPAAWVVETQTAGTPVSSFYGVAAHPSNLNAMVVGTNSYVKTTSKTTTGGFQWDYQYSTLPASPGTTLRSVELIALSPTPFFVVVGDNGTILALNSTVTMDTPGEVTLTNYSPSGVTTSNLYDVAYNGSNLLVAIGVSGTIINASGLGSWTMVNNGSTVKNVYTP